MSERWSTVPNASGHTEQEYMDAAGDLPVDENGNPITEMEPTLDEQAYREWLHQREKSYVDAFGDKREGNEAAHAANENAAEQEEMAALEQSVMDNVELRRMYMIAQEIASLREAPDSGDNQNRIKDKEARLEELVVAYDLEDEKFYQGRLAEGRTKVSVVEQINGDRNKTKEQLDFILEATVNGSHETPAAAAAEKSPEQKLLDQFKKDVVERGLAQQLFEMHQNKNAAQQAVEAARAEHGDDSDAAKEAQQRLDDINKLIAAVEDIDVQKMLADEAAEPKAGTVDGIDTGEPGKDDVIDGIDIGQDTPENLKAKIARLEKSIADKIAELEAMDFEDKAGEKGSALRQEIKALDAELETAKAQLASQEQAANDEEKEPKPTEDPEKSKADAEKERAAERNQQFVELRTAAFEKHKEQYDAIMKELGNVNAKLAMNMFGREKNRRRAYDLSQELAKMNGLMLREMMSKGEQDGRYSVEGIEDQAEVDKMIRQMKSDDALWLSSITTREMYNQQTLAMETRQKNRNPFQKMAGWVGNKLYRGRHDTVKTMGAGFASGFVPSALTAAAGATFPISVAAIGGVGALTGGLALAGSREVGIADALKNRDGSQLTDEAIAAVRQEMDARTSQVTGYTPEQLAAYYTGNLLTNEREANVDTNKDINKKSIGRMVKFGGGFLSGVAAGNLAGNFAHNVLNPPTPNNSGPVNPGPGNTPSNPGNIPPSGHEVLNTHVNVGNGGGGEQVIRDILNSNGMDASKFTDSQLIQMWQNNAANLFPGSDQLYGMADKLTGINHAGGYDLAQNAVQNVVNAAKVIHP